MKVDIKPVEKSQGLIGRKKLHGISLSVGFSDEEKAIIRERKLDRVVLMERDVPADVNEEKHAKRGLAKLVVTAAVSGRDANHFGLTFGKLLRGPDVYFFDTPIEVKDYIEQLKTEILPLTKAYLEGNKEAATADSFEL